MRWALRLSWVAICALASGCFTASYLGQAARGQLALLSAARPLDRAVSDPSTSDAVRRLLVEVPRIKAFGQHKGLSPTRNYDRYADLRRPAAVWVVQACAPLSFDVRRWTFLGVGSVPYLGFFDPREAEAYATQLARDERLDVVVRTASAYSTLGVLRDPVLSTMIPDGAEAAGELANVVLHESVHATLYLPSQSSFNESLASFVADRLTSEYLERTRGGGSGEAVAWARAQQRHQARVRRLRRAYQDLDAVYRSPAGQEEKRAHKARLLEALTRELALPKPPNNASLAGLATYSSGEAGFARLLEACQGQWPRFFATLSRLGRADFGGAQREELDSVLARVAERGCAPAAAAAGPGSSWGGFDARSPSWD